MNYVEVDFYGALSEIEVAERMEDGYAVIPLASGGAGSARRFARFDRGSASAAGR